MNTKTSSGLDNEYDPNSMDANVAMERMLAAIQPIHEFEQVGIHAALDRVLAKNVLSPIDVPAYDNSAMDGYAINSVDIPQTETATLLVVGKSMAGHPYPNAVARGQAVRIMTGAAIPTGCDTVVMQEHVTREGANILIDNRIKPEQNVRRAGDDLSRGGVALPQGRWITPADLGLLASLGISETTVYRRPRVTFFSTGDELRSLGESLGEGQIYDSNRYTIFGLLTRLGVQHVDMGVIKDDKESVKRALLVAAKNSDAIITSGGVSVGDADYVRGLLEEIGQVNFWKIAMKPGKPLAFGKIQNAYFFGLPGNPVSAMVTFYQFVKPALLALIGHSSTNPTTIRMRCVSRLKKAPGRIEYQRGVIKTDNNGEFVVESTGPQGSHVLRSMSVANCFIVLPLECGNVEIGSVVDVQPFYGLV